MSNKDRELLLRTVGRDLKWIRRTQALARAVRLAGVLCAGAAFLRVGADLYRLLRG